MEYQKAIAVEGRQVKWGWWLQWVAATVGSLALVAEVVRRLFPVIFGLHVGTVIATGLVVMGLVGVAQGLVLRRFGVPLRTWTLATVAGSTLIIAMALLWTPFYMSPGPGVAVREIRPDGSVREWTGEEIALGNNGALIAVADGAVGHLTPAGGSVAVGSLGSGVHIGDFDTIPGILGVWVVGGASVGVAQWLVLRRRLSRASRWITASVLGKVAAGISGYIVLGLMRNLVTTLEVPLIVSLAGMGVYSAVQGAVTGAVIVSPSGFHEKKN